MSQFNHALLKRIQQTLPSGDAAEKIDAIIERPDAEAYIQALEPDVLYNLIREAGWDQGVDLVPFAAPEQLQVCVDMDAWRRDRFVPARFAPWLAAVVEDATDARFKRVARELDAEVMAMFFKANLEILDLDEGRIPDDAPDRTTTTPDGVFGIVYPEDEALGALMRRLVDRLYELDRVLAWTLFEAVRWELQSEMEEYALRWRTSRLEEFGFVARDEALAVYRPLDPLALREKIEREELQVVFPPAPRQTLDLPQVFSSELDEEFLIVRAIQAIEDDELMQTRLFELLALVNKVLVADGIEPGEVGGGRQVLRRALGYMSLGLEFMARGDEARAMPLLGVLTLRQLFRAGFTLTARLQHQARQLERRPTLTLVAGEAFSLLRPDDAALLEELMRQRPTYARSALEFELFQHPAQVDDAAVRLGRIALKQLWTFALQRLSIEDLVALTQREGLLNEPIDFTFDALFTTWLAHHIIEGRGSFEPLERAQVAALLGALREEPWAEVGARQHFAAIFEGAQAFLPGGADRLLDDWLTDTLATLQDELGQLRDAEDALVIQQLLLLSAA